MDHDIGKNLARSAEMMAARLAISWSRTSAQSSS
jgi:hypothetical protein